ncbi:uncharacterized protein LOC114714004 isoform X1 [Neltuma alba]|uniref:uncharacterized protein LOC114714004 isoform X1 n=1 Tax=Neltuma alba TaxID=207710 RepID=UPI0010A405C7|nr:uncharacterized protein LOC114714004 isoform X1 [Prosopis alba]
MGSLVKLIDPILMFFWVILLIVVPFLDTQIFIPVKYYPRFLIQLNEWLVRESGHYLMIEKPYFFMGIVFHDFAYQTPLVICNFYGLLTSKPWLRTTLLIYGGSLTASLVPTLTEMVGSGKAPAQLLMSYGPFYALGFLATLRGLLTPHDLGKSPQMSANAKKHA